MAKKKKLILIAEDEKDIRDIYKIKCEHEGFDIIEAEDGDIALEMLEQGKKPDLILLDLIMPKMSGYEVLKNIRKNPKYKKIPIFILSNLGQEVEVKEGLRLQADKYFIKANYTPEEIIDKIKQYFK